ncbi:unnamed protein product [Caenorhabditis nigoni]
MSFKSGFGQLALMVDFRESRKQLNWTIRSRLKKTWKKGNQNRKLCQITRARTRCKCLLKSLERLPEKKVCHIERAQMPSCRLGMIFTSWILFDAHSLSQNVSNMSLPIRGTQLDD